MSCEAKPVWQYLPTAWHFFQPFCLNNDMSASAQSLPSIADKPKSATSTAGFGRWLVIVAVVAVSGMVSAFYALNEYSSGTGALVQSAKRNSDRFETIYRDSTETHKKTLRLGLDAIFDNTEIISAFAKDDRPALMAKVLPFYEEVLKRRNEIDQFIFWLPPAKLYLRSSDPKSFGVDASGVRPLVVAANEKRTAFTAMEAGVGGILGLRAIAPVMDGTRLVGSIELGSDLTPLLMRAATTSGLEFAAGLDQKRAEVVQRPADPKNDAVQGTDVFYIYSNAAAGEIMRKVAINPRSTAAQVTSAGDRTVFIRTFPLNNFSGVPTVVVATILDLTEGYASVLRTVAIKTAILFVLAVIICLVGIFKFGALKASMSQVLSRQRAELEEKAAFCEAATAKLKDVDLIKRGFFTNLITAVNEPLQAVAGTLQSVTSEVEASTPASKVNERLRFALSETKRLSGLISDYQQIELFRQKLVKSESPLTSLADVAAGALEDELAMYRRLPQLKITTEIPRDLPAVRADADLLRRAIAALVTYAARGAGNGKIALQGDLTASGWVRLSITGSAFELAGAPTDGLLDESRQFLSRLATEHAIADSGLVLIPIVLARMTIEYYGGTLDASPANKANPGFVLVLPAAI